jgi:hypothetical protein
MKHRNRSSRKGKTIAVLAAFAMVVCQLMGASIASAHEMDDATQGFYLGLTLMGSSIHADDTIDEVFTVEDDGGGAQIQLGYHFTPSFALELSFGGANHETNISEIDTDIGLAQIFALYRFAPGQPFRPYIKGGIGGYGLTFDGKGADVTAKGGGLAFGGGFSFFFTPHFALGIDFTHNIIRYNEIELSFDDITIGTEIDEEGSLSTLGLSFSYFF